MIQPKITSFFKHVIFKHIGLKEKEGHEEKKEKKTQKLITDYIDPLGNIPTMDSSIDEDHFDGSEPDFNPLVNGFYFIHEEIENAP